MRKVIILFCVSFGFLFSCVELEQVSPIPEIGFQSFEFTPVFDTNTQQYLVLGLLEFSFIDGDADLGVYDFVHTDTSSIVPDSAKNGIFLKLFEKTPKGAYVEQFLTQEIADSPWVDTVKFNYLLPYDERMDRVGQNKIIKGIIRIGIPFPEFDEAPFDSIRFEFYIRDRALNKSNVEYTSDIGWPSDSLFN